MVENLLFNVEGVYLDLVLQNKWKIRLQLTKPVTWPPLIWGIVCGAAASGTLLCIIWEWNHLLSWNLNTSSFLLKLFWWTFHMSTSGTCADIWMLRALEIFTSYWHLVYSESFSIFCIIFSICPYEVTFILE